MLKPALCVAALSLAATVAIPAIAQQSPQSENPPAAGPSTPGPQAGPEGRGPGPGWRGYPRERYSDDDEGRGRRWRQWEGRRGDDEDRGPRGWHQRRFGGREGMMGERRHGMRGFDMMARVCGPDGGRMGEMMINRLERLTQPTAEQRPNFDKLKEAAGKASDMVRGACTAERPMTPTGRLANAEKRLAAMLEAVRTVRPAMDAYYGSLSDEQKARLIMAQHMGRPGMGEGWRERMQRWRDRMHRDDSRDDRTQREQQSDDDDESERL